MNWTEFLASKKAKALLIGLVIALGLAFSHDPVLMDMSRDVVKAIITYILAQAGVDMAHALSTKAPTE